MADIWDTIIIGAGMGGLAAALDLVSAGERVLVVEKEAAPGGKMRHLDIDGRPIDAGPTVFTMRWVFEALFHNAGAELSDHVDLTQAHLLARHAWNTDTTFDLYADRQESADAIGGFAGPANAKGYQSFCDDARAIAEILKPTFMEATRPNPISLTARVLQTNPAALGALLPRGSMWQALGRYFPDKRLQQLFGRYATYVGGSPFATPDTLMLIAHMEQEGVCYVTGGMHALATAIAALAQEHGASFQYETSAAEIVIDNGAACGVKLSDGKILNARSVIFNGDVSAIGSGLMGSQAKPAVDAVAPADRSLSALTWVANAKTSGFPLVHHNVFFSEDYRSEFQRILSDQSLPDEPTVYICAQDRADDASTVLKETPERLLILVNAPACGDQREFGEQEIEQCLTRTKTKLARCGLSIDLSTANSLSTSPAGFNRLFPGTGGALYGRSPHGRFSTFRRPASQSRIPGLYLAGGSTHPGAGVPMACLSGRLAAAKLLTDRASTRRFRRAATIGGTSTA